MERNPKVAAALLRMREKKRPRGYLFWGDELGDVTCPPVRQFPGVETLMDLFAVLELCWARETAYPSCQAEWVASDPSYGQCAITAMLVHDMFGASIYKLRNSSGGTHYFNNFDGAWVDLTREQFDLYDLPVPYELGQEVPRKFCGRNRDTLARYRLLQRRIMDYLK